MSITFLAATTTQHPEWGTVLAPVRTADHLSVNVSNGNAALILERLGYPCGGDELWGEAAGDELLGRVMVANVGRDDTGVAATEDRGAGGAVLVDCGVRDGYFTDVMDRLAALGTHAADNGWMVSWA
jgi:hypothetical protein